MHLNTGTNMDHKGLQRLFLLTCLLLGGQSAAVPLEHIEERCQPRILCIDGLSPCGVRYGGCYDVCDVSAKPVPPPCPVSTIKTATPTSTKQTSGPTITSSKPATTSTPYSSSCSATATVCWDGINECGQTYGGCFPDCSPWPTFTPPPCDSTSTSSILPLLTPAINP